MFELKFSPVTIKHLGINMYSTLPPVLAEFITNAYDADASIVSITINQNIGEIIIEDDGHGMSAEEMNKEFLKIGRNRRHDSSSNTSKYGRLVTGKKGIGKLSVFGICKTIHVESCHNNVLNSFKIDYDTLLKQGEEDKPLELETIENNTPLTKKNYTRIILTNIKRKTAIRILDTANSILNRLNIFSTNFRVNIQDEKIGTFLTEARRKDIIYNDKQFEWKIPEGLTTEKVAIDGTAINQKIKVDQDVLDYFKDNNIHGNIFTTESTLSEDLLGVTLFARNKLANSPSFFGTKTSNNHSYSYMSGELHIDFMDREDEDDNISTARNSLLWENDKSLLLEQYLQEVLKKIASTWKELRRERKKLSYEKNTNFNYSWFEKTINSKHEKELAKKITDLVLDSPLEEKQAVDILNYVESAFEFETFMGFAQELENNNDAGKLLLLLKNLEVIEAKEHYRLALVRIKTIEKFEKMIIEDTLEVGGDDSMHQFLNTFPWILEPRISSFEEEKTFKKLLEDTFPIDTTLNIEDRRIDFICKNFGDTIYIIEIKRSQRIINNTDLNQLQDYYTFLNAHIEENKSDRSKIRNVKAYIVGKKLSNSNLVRSKLKQLERNNMNFLGYKEMLNQAQEYHKEFIDTYEKTNSLRS